MKFEDMTTDEIGNEFSDFYKEVNNFRPRHVDFNDREALISAYTSELRDMELRYETEHGRASLRFDGFVADYRHGDSIEFKGHQYVVSFVTSEGDVAKEYELTPVYRTYIPKINVSAKALRDAEPRYR